MVKEFVMGDGVEDAIEALRGLVSQYHGPSDVAAVECLAEALVKSKHKDLFAEPMIDIDQQVEMLLSDKEVLPLQMKGMIMRCDRLEKEAKEQSAEIERLRASEKLTNDAALGLAREHNEISDEIEALKAKNRKLSRLNSDMLWALKAADVMAKATDRLIELGQIDSRSIIGDARLDYGQPHEYKWETVLPPIDSKEVKG